MRTSTKRMAKGIFHEVRGTAKRMVGSLISNRTLETKGRFERITGKVQRKIGKVQGAWGF
ncbi:MULTISPECIES: CsbD family protein [Geobacteraceae]|uniref:CsbD family protein n=1 Tax=Geomobilimonas luticola TaxID=1114878 RepID=A0ABS5S8I2_9BACT|nr:MULTISPECIES: CsbD family protein [Geobacteraceae]MBT0651669.1 CsbD family protein [Geomobilimonas luticola]GFE57110.1 hypothetical protein AOG1_09890 [Geobacter sp. AOG1]